jgi:hypothetical protein
VVIFQLEGMILLEIEEGFVVDDQLTVPFTRNRDQQFVFLIFFWGYAAITQEKGFHEGRSHLIDFPR